VFDPEKFPDLNIDRKAWPPLQPAGMVAPTAAQ
jgi:hypothetical protein